MHIFVKNVHLLCTTLCLGFVMGIEYVKQFVVTDILITLLVDNTRVHLKISLC